MLFMLPRLIINLRVTIFCPNLTCITGSGHLSVVTMLLRTGATGTTVGSKSIHTSVYSHIIMLTSDTEVLPITEKLNLSG